MIAYTTLLLFLTGVFSSVKVRVKVDKALSWLTFGAVFFVFANFCSAMNVADEHIFSFVWNTATGNNLKLEIISNIHNYMLILPCFALTVLSMLNSLIFRYEERRSAYFSVLIFNLIAFIVLITSNNFVQLLSALFVIDSIALFMIKDVEAYKRYVLLNLLADMILFAVLATINCRVASLDIRQIISYRSVGMHQDFVALAGLTAVFAKFGFFLLQIGVTGLKNLRFHRIFNVLFLSSPLAAMILLLKFNALWRTSPYFTTYLDIVCICTIVWGALGGLFDNNLKAKFIYWQTAFWALFTELLRFHGFVWFSGFSFLLLEMYLFAGVLYVFYYYNNRKRQMTQIKNTPLSNKAANAYAVFLLVAVIAAMTNTLTILYNNLNRYYIWTFSLLFILTVSAVIKQMFSGREKNIISKPADKSIKYFMFAELSLLSIFLLQDWQYMQPCVWGIPIFFILLCRYTPLAKAEFVYHIEIIQNGNILERIYHSLIKSLRLCGKCLWLLVDRFFMEKIVLAGFTAVVYGLTRFFGKLFGSKIIGKVMGVLLLLLLLVFSYYYHTEHGL